MFNGLICQIFGVLWLSIYLSAVQAASSREVFSAALGKMPIVLEISAHSPQEVTGRYVYQKLHRDLALNGTLQGPAMARSGRCCGMRCSGSIRGSGPGVAQAVKPQGAISLPGLVPRESRNGPGSRYWR